MRPIFPSLHRRLSILVRQPAFLWLTFVGNGTMVAGALLFHHVESGANPAVGSFLDSLVWSVGLVTTVGATHVTAATAGGKVLSIFMMIFGAIFLWLYMALFVGALVSPEIRFEVEAERRPK